MTERPNLQDHYVVACNFELSAGSQREADLAQMWIADIEYAMGLEQRGHDKTT